jgi:hypothetical protein
MEMALGWEIRLTFLNRNDSRLTSVKTGDLVILLVLLIPKRSNLTNNTGNNAFHGLFAFLSFHRRKGRLGEHGRQRLKHPRTNSM